MYNNAKPELNELPSARKLLRSTVAALLVAIVLLVAVVLPAEYALDPTGAGRMLGLTEMGEIKRQLASEAAADAAQDAATGDAPANASAIAPPAAPAVPETPVAAPAEAWQDEMQVVLQPGQGAEIKLAMKAGEQAQFSWVVQGGAVVDAADRLGWGWGGRWSSGQDHQHLSSDGR